MTAARGTLRVILKPVKETIRVTAMGAALTPCEERFNRSVAKRISTQSVQYFVRALPESAKISASLA